MKEPHILKKNTNTTVEYDDSRGNHRDRVRVGSKPRNDYRCRERCGGDCDGLSIII